MKHFFNIKGASKWSLRFIVAWSFIALFAPLLSNDKALLLVDENGTHFPFISNYSHKSETVKIIVKAPIPYHHNNIDYKNTNAIGPFNRQNIESTYYRHWLGTDYIGRDVLAGLIHGSRTAILIGFGAMLIAFLIGAFLGSIAAYVGDQMWRFSAISIIIIIAGFAFWLIATYSIVPWEIGSINRLKVWLIFLLITLVIAGASYLALLFLNKIIPTKKYYLPIDLLIGRLIEIMESIPLLFLLIALSVVFKPSISSVVLIIGLVAWPSIAKFTRAEVLKIKNTDYVENSKALGLTKMQILIQHILPNALGPITITLTFGLAAAILLESTLSFMGLGVSSETASWGQILSSARQNYTAWWLALFPGGLIFLTLLAINTLGDRLTKQ